MAHTFHHHFHHHLQLPKILRNFLPPGPGNEQDRGGGHRDEAEPPLRHLLRRLGQAHPHRHPGAVVIKLFLSTIYEFSY